MSRMCIHHGIISQQCRYAYGPKYGVSSAKLVIVLTILSLLLYFHNCSDTSSNSLVTQTRAHICKQLAQSHVTAHKNCQTATNRLDRREICRVVWDSRTFHWWCCTGLRRVMRIETDLPDTGRRRCRRTTAQSIYSRDCSPVSNSCPHQNLDKQVRDRKEPKIFVFVFSLGSLTKRVQFWTCSEYFEKLCSCSVQVLWKYGLGSSSMELETRFYGDHLLLINCNCKHQLTDWRQRS